jgi:hypothetical protein
LYDFLYQAIKIFELKLQDECWFECKKTIGKYKGTSITKTCVSQLAWNKQGNDLIAIGTTSGYVVVYEASNAYKNIMQVKGHDGIWSLIARKHQQYRMEYWLACLLRLFLF